jgi:hypothetical protein
MKMVVISQKHLDELFDALVDKLRLQKYISRTCKCELISGQRPTESMHQQMHYHIHGFKKAIEEA